MGLVLIDLTFRVEREFSIKIPDGWMNDLGLLTADDDVTLAQYHDYIRAQCHAQGVDVPDESWDRLVELVAAASGMSAKQITPDTWLGKDVAPDG